MAESSVAGAQKTVWRRFARRPAFVDAVQLTAQSFDPVHASAPAIPGVSYDADQRCAYIEALGGRVRAEIGDWIVRGIKGELYPCKPDIFEALYEPIDD